MTASALRNRFKSYRHVLRDVQDFLDSMPVYTKRDGAAVIYAFNSLFDLSWKLMRDSLSEYYGYAEVPASPKKIIAMARQNSLISDNANWLTVADNRNLSTHDYMGINQEKYCELIASDYMTLMKELEVTIKAQLDEMKLD